MKSRISIDVDNDHKPIIKIDFIDSGDVRDKLVKRFLQSFGGNNGWAKFYFNSNIAFPGDRHVDLPETEAVIKPICAYDLPIEQGLFDSMAENQRSLQKQLSKIISPVK